MFSISCYEKYFKSTKLGHRMFFFHLCKACCIRANEHYWIDNSSFDLWSKLYFIST